MSVASMLENMKRRALDSTYDAYICEEYDAWAVESFATEEGEYDAARLEISRRQNLHTVPSMMFWRYRLSFKASISSKEICRCHPRSG